MCRGSFLTTKDAKNGREGREEEQVPPLRFPFPLGMGSSGRDDKLLFND
jgi:hypothetical protein